MYWVYRLPNWFFELLTVSIFVGFSLGGIFPTRRWMRRIHAERSHNDIVGFYLAGVTVLYGVSLGLLAIGAWTTYTDTQAKVTQEAAALSSFYRSVGSLPQPARSSLQNDLRRYTRQIIDVSWPQQQRGIVPIENIATLDKIQQDFESFEPTSEAQKVLVANIAREFEGLEASRSLRMDSVSTELPPPLWALILFGAAICIIVTWFFDLESQTMHISMNVLIACLLGLMVFMVASLDNPYRGKISVSSAPFERVYGQMSNPNK